MLSRLALGSSRVLRSGLFIGCLSSFLLTHPASATPPAITAPTEGAAEEPGSNDAYGLGFMNGITKSSNLLGDMWGIRPFLSQYGMSFNMLETSEVLGNVTGGIHKSFDYDGLTQMSLGLDTQAAFGWYGGSFNISALQIHGRNLSADNLQTIQTASGIEADRATRLWELWYDQKFLDQDRLDVKIGQQSIDSEFMVSSNSLLFVNTMMGWPTIPSYDMPGGGPAYPLSALGIRAQGRPVESVNILGGIYNGSPTNKTGMNKNGAGFPMDGGILAIGEVQFSYPALGAMVRPDQGRQLSGTYKLGAWYNTENFADLRYDNTGLSLADPATSGTPMQHHGNYGLYGVVDQMIWGNDEPQESENTLNVFARVMGTPQADRNLIDFSVNAGLVLHEPFEHRDDDSAGIGFGYAHVSNRAAQLAQDTTAGGTYTPASTGETFVELTYQYQIFPWWQVQPDFQYVFNVAGGALDPNDGQRIRNEAVIGLRTNIAF